jgi:hypothetical protein
MTENYTAGGWPEGHKVTKDGRIVHVEKFTLENLIGWLGELRNKSIEYRLEKDREMDEMIAQKAPELEHLIKTRVMVFFEVQKFLMKKGLSKKEAEDVWYAIKTGNEDGKDMSQDVIGAIELRYSGEMDLTFEAMR